MYWNELLQRSRAEWKLRPGYAAALPGRGLFGKGASWMAARMHAQPRSLRAVPFEWYGLLKYGMAVLALVLSGGILYRLRPALAVLSILAFYLVEIHFLFLFPLLIDGAASPLRQCLRQPYRLGLLRTLATVMPIAFYMLLGLARFRRPLYNWHIGCLAILIWYRDAFGDRK